jgi:hypothetical protein
MVQNIIKTWFEGKETKKKSQKIESSSDGVKIL